MCSGSASGVFEAHGIARCGREAPIGLVEGYELIIPGVCDGRCMSVADHENFVIFGSSSAWQRANVLKIGVRGA